MRFLDSTRENIPYILYMKNLKKIFKCGPPTILVPKNFNEIFLKNLFFAYLKKIILLIHLKNKFRLHVDTKRAFSKRGQNVRNKPRVLKGPSLRSLTMMKMPNFLPKERLLSRLVSVYRVKKREIFDFEPNFSKKIFQNDPLWGGGST